MNLVCVRLAPCVTDLNSRKHCIFNLERLFSEFFFQVYSGFRFARHAKELNKPLAILNIGDTRADKIADLKINARIGEVLPKIKV